LILIQSLKHKNVERIKVCVIVCLNITNEDCKTEKCCLKLLTCSTYLSLNSPQFHQSNWAHSACWSLGTDGSRGWGERV